MSYINLTKIAQTREQVNEVIESVLEGNYLANQKQRVNGIKVRLEHGELNEHEAWKEIDNIIQTPHKEVPIPTESKVPIDKEKSMADYLQQAHDIIDKKHMSTFPDRVYKSNFLAEILDFVNEVLQLKDLRVKIISKTEDEVDLVVYALCSNQVDYYRLRGFVDRKTAKASPEVFVYFNKLNNDNNYVESRIAFININTRAGIQKVEDFNKGLNRNSSFNNLLLRRI